jgi:hypothetical protein
VKLESPPRSRSRSSVRRRLAPVATTAAIFSSCLAWLVSAGACAGDRPESPPDASSDASVADGATADGPAADGSAADGPVPIGADAAVDAAAPPHMPDGAVADAAPVDAPPAAAADAAAADAAAPDAAAPLGELRLFSGNQQSGVVDAPLPVPFVVQVKDATDAPVANVVVSFVVTAGGGSLTVTSATTDADGKAHTTLRLGPLVGANRVAASSPGVGGSPVVFTASALAGPPSRIVYTSGNGQRRMLGLDLLAPFVVTVRDAHTNPVSGVVVSFAVTGGAGHVSAAQATTDAQGRARTLLTMGLALETNTVEARVAGLAGSPVVFSVLADGFLSRVSFGVTQRPVSLAAGDLNGDGKPDLVTANTITPPSLLINSTFAGSSEPTFVPVLDPSIGGGYAADVATADLNGDGKLDVVLADSYSLSTSVNFMLNTSAPGASLPSFGPVEGVLVGPQPLTRVAVGDLNADGRPDIVVSTDRIMVAVLINTTAPGAAAATFAPPVVLYTSGGQVSGIAIGDLNGDGRPDLAVAGANSNGVAVLLNQTGTGSSTASFAARVLIASGQNAMAVALGDLNGDGRLDMAVAAFDDNEVAVHLNTTPEGSTVPSFAPKVGFRVALHPQSVAVGDLDGDGMPDVAAACDGWTTGLVSVLVNTEVPGASTPSFGNLVDYPTGLQPRKVLMLDVNGDGRTDLATCNMDENTVSILLVD